MSRHFAHCENCGHPAYGRLLCEPCDLAWDPSPPNPLRAEIASERAIDDALMNLFTIMKGGC